MRRESTSFGRRHCRATFVCEKFVTLFWWHVPTSNPETNLAARRPKLTPSSTIMQARSKSSRRCCSSTMGDDASSENVRLEVQEGASATGEAVWKDAGPISLLDSLQSHQQSPPATSCPTSTQTTPLPKQAKEWLLSKHSIKMKKDRQNLYLFRNAPDNGVNTNLLILLHGSGDSHRPFDKLAQTMSLPQTATLSISSMVCGIELPFGLGSSWFQELDYSSGNPLPRANANRQTTLGVAVAYLTELLRSKYLLLGTRTDIHIGIWCWSHTGVGDVSIVDRPAVGRSHLHWNGRVGRHSYRIGHEQQWYSHSSTISRQESFRCMQE